jgi:hypothetical protein
MINLTLAIAWLNEYDALQHKLLLMVHLVSGMPAEIEDAEIHLRRARAHREVQDVCEQVLYGSSRLLAPLSLMMQSSPTASAGSRASATVHSAWRADERSLVVVLRLKRSPTDNWRPNTSAPWTAPNAT